LTGFVSRRIAERDDGAIIDVQPSRRQQTGQDLTLSRGRLPESGAISIESTP
jgi:hypothetical protein